MKSERTNINVPVACILAFSLALSAFALSGKTAQGASATVDIPEKYETIKAGGPLYFSLDILYPENDRRQDLTITYTVLEGDQVIATAENLKAIETQASFTDYIPIPKTAKSGIHTIEAQIQSSDSSFDEHVSASFIVVAPGNSFILYFYLILGTIIAIGIIIFIEIFHFWQKQESEIKKISRN